MHQTENSRITYFMNLEKKIFRSTNDLACSEARAGLWYPIYQADLNNNINNNNNK